MQIVKVSNNILTKKAKPIKKFDKKLSLLAKDMVETLKKARNPEGVGLAAPQVGVSKRLFVIQINPNSSKSKPKYQTFINPEIVSSSPIKNLPDYPNSPKKSSSNILEGCLSIEKVWGYPSRSSWVKLTYKDILGKERTRILSGFPAIIVQHEIDHLNGILFTQRVLEQKGELYKMEKDEKTKEKVLVPLEI